MKESEIAQSCLTLCNPWTVACTRLLPPWDSLGKNTGVGCHFLLQGIEPGSCTLQADALLSEPPGKPYIYTHIHIYIYIYIYI